MKIEFDQFTLELPPEVDLEIIKGEKNLFRVVVPPRTPTEQVEEQERAEALRKLVDAWKTNQQDLERINKEQKTYPIPHGPIPYWQYPYYDDNPWWKVYCDTNPGQTVWDTPLVQCTCGRYDQHKKGAYCA